MGRTPRLPKGPGIAGVAPTLTFLTPTLQTSPPTHKAVVAGRASQQCRHQHIIVFILKKLFELHTKMQKDKYDNCLTDSSHCHTWNRDREKAAENYYSSS